MARPLKHFVRAKWPRLFRWWRRIKPSRARSAQQTFTRKFRKHVTGELDSLSGPGSDLAQTEAVRQALPRLLGELRCRTLLDVPCGDFYWMKRVKIDVEYI